MWQFDNERIWKFWEREFEDLKMSEFENPIQCYLVKKIVCGELTSEIPHQVRNDKRQINLSAVIPAKAGISN